MASVSARKHTVPGLLRLVREYGGATPVDAARSAELLAQIRAYAMALAAGQPAGAGELVVTLTLQEVWEAAGGNPGIKPSKAEVLEALHMLDEVCDEADTSGAPVRFGCHCDLEPGMEPDGCVLDNGRPEDCVHTRSGKVKQREKCEHWQPVKISRRDFDSDPALRDSAQKSRDVARALDAGADLPVAVAWIIHRPNRRPSTTMDKSIADAFERIEGATVTPLMPIPGAAPASKAGTQ